MSDLHQFTSVTPNESTITWQLNCSATHHKINPHKQVSYTNACRYHVHSKVLESTPVKKLFPGEPGLLIPPRLLPLVPQVILSRDKWQQMLSAGCPSRHWNNSVKHWRKTSNTDPNHTKSPTGIALSHQSLDSRGMALLSLHWLSNTRTKSQLVVNQTWPQRDHHGNEIKHTRKRASLECHVRTPQPSRGCQCWQCTAERVWCGLGCGLRGHCGLTESQAASAHCSQRQGLI